jgi:DNA mismatch repair protein MutL
MGRIRVLPERLVNRIAAGEVIERPASAVKELLENSLDAGATSISIRIEEGGRRLVEVLDDGSGMDADDAIASLERHATSKLTEETPLEAIATLGFRGEALPSIAAVSRFTLTTAMDDTGGSRVIVEGGAIRSSGPAAHPRGTTVSVRDLFFNTPARRRFLRSAATEIGHIVEAVTSLALSRPGLRLRLEHGPRRIFDLPPAADLMERVAQIEGPDAARMALPIDASRGTLSMHGAVLAGHSSGASRAARRFIVNGRVVRDRILLRAASSALQSSLPAGSAASCMIVLTLPPELVDVNVHPAKAEVRFAEPGAVHDLVRDGLRDALSRGRPIREAWAPGAETAAGARTSASGEDRLRSIADAAAVYVSRSVPGHAEEFFAGRPWPDAGRDVAHPWPPPAGESAAPEPVSNDAPHGAPVVVGHYRNGYILAEDDLGLVLIDQHAAHERILFEQMASSAAAAATAGGRGRATQSLLFPRSVPIPVAMRGRTDDAVQDLLRLGFEAEAFGEETLIVRGVPAPLGEADPESLVLEILVAAGEGAPGALESRRTKMLATAACHAAVKVPADLPREKIEFILSRLLLCETPLRCPHGRPTMLRWDHRSIERRFGRP